MSENIFSCHMIVIYGEVAIFVCNFNYNQQTSALKGHNRFSTQWIFVKLRYYKDKCVLKYILQALNLWKGSGGDIQGQKLGFKL